MNQIKSNESNQIKSIKSNEINQSIKSNQIIQWMNEWMNQSINQSINRFNDPNLKQVKLNVFELCWNFPIDTRQFQQNSNAGDGALIGM